MTGARHHPCNGDGSEPDGGAFFEYDADGNLRESGFVLDMDCDGSLDLYDIDVFVQALISEAAYE